MKYAFSGLVDGDGALVMQPERFSKARMRNYLAASMAALSATVGCSNYKNNLPASPTYTAAQASAQASDNSKSPISPLTANYKAAPALGDIASNFVPGPPTPQPVNRPAYGVLERVDCEFNFILGWALDPDNLNISIPVHVYNNGPAGSPEGVLVGGYMADMPRKGIGPHGFRIDMPKEFKDGKAHTLFVHAIDIQGWPNQVLYDMGRYVSSNGIEMPKTLVCFPEE